MYRINYNTGAGDVECDDDDLDEAKKIADAGAGYSQQPITIETIDGDIVSERPWCSIGDAADEMEPIEFGDFGFYGDWIDED